MNSEYILTQFSIVLDLVLYGTPLQKSKTDKPDPNNPESARKYNSQFNPHLAKQNKLDAKEKYWLS